jgi:glyoxylase-like metal-dependent hydrolase (beta-lactamase superfamily II)
MKCLFAIIAAVLSVSAIAQPSKFDAVQIKVHQVAQNVYMLEGEGGNIGVSVGEDGVLLIDDQFAPLTQKIVDAVKTITDKPIRFLLNTHWHGDHTGGNENLGKLGVIIIAHDNVYKRLSVEQTNLLGKTPASPKIALPIVTFNDRIVYHLNGDEITAYHIPPAHTDTDSFVRFRNANVVHTGDVFASGRYPFIDSTNGGSVKGIIEAIDKLLPTLDDFTKVIPGHGPLSTKREVIAYRKMISTVATRVEKMVKQGKTLEQVIAAKPLKEFDEEWGKFRKTDVFIPFVYYSYAPYKK